MVGYEYPRKRIVQGVTNVIVQIVAARCIGDCKIETRLIRDFPGSVIKLNVVLINAFVIARAKGQGEKNGGQSNQAIRPNYINSAFLSLSDPDLHLYFAA